MSDDNELPDGVEDSLDEVFAKVAGLTGFTPLETARLFISYAVMNFEQFSCGESLAEELDMAAKFITDPRTRTSGVRH